MKKVSIVFDNSKMRYQTLGDYYEVTPEDGDRIEVLKVPDPRYAQLIALHELVEMWLCQYVGISNEDIDKFDLWFESQQLPGEPGDDIRAPYYLQHQFATVIERLMAMQMDVDWHHYLRTTERVLNHTLKDNKHERNSDL